ncbi:hypothetical protein DFP72DRAFT_928841, partial [Ephemerocybe angulata]
MISLYDFDTKLPGRSLSPFVWKIRFALNMKDIEHQTHWIPFSKVAKVLEQQGIPRSTEAPVHYGNGRTVPALYDSSTGIKMSDSRPILAYLDATYTNSPKLLIRPKGDAQLETLVADAFNPSWGIPFAMMRPIWTLMGPKIVLEGFDGEDAVNYRPRVEEALKMTVEDFVHDKVGQERYRHEAREAFRAADEWLGRARKLHGGRWALGDAITLADIELGTALVFIASILGEKDELWVEIVSGWDGGRWGTYWDLIKQYRQV